MRRTWFVPVLAMTLLATTGCAQMRLGTHLTKSMTDAPAPYSAPAVTGPRKIGQPYEILGKTYYPIPSSEGFTEKGIASWYGKEFHGKPTANGEVYNMYDITAAHPTLPLPTYVRVTNLENGRSLVVRVNDRGPFLRSRVIDLSMRSAQLLGMDKQGTAPVLLEALPTDGSRLARSQQVAQRIQQVETRQDAIRLTERVTNSSSDDLPVVETPNVDVAIYVQTGAFSSRENAVKQSQEVGRIYNNTRIMETQVNGKAFYRVRVGPLANVGIADEVLARLLQNKFNDAIIAVE